jgi:surface antigen Omp85-like protein
MRIPLPPRRWLPRILTLAVMSSVFAVSTAAQDVTPAAEPPLTDATPEPDGLLAEPDMVRRVVVIADRRFNFGEVTDGFYTVLGRVPGAGWLSGGLGYRRWYQNDHLFVDSSTMLSWRGYKMAQARAELPRLLHSRLLVGSQLRWQDFTQVDFYGEGSGSARSDRSQYRIRSKIFGGYATLRPIRTLAIDTRIDWLRPSVLTASGLFQPGVPDARTLFASDPVFTLTAQPTFFHREAAVTLDTRDFPARPTAGAVYRAAVADYGDRDVGLFNFRRYELEAARFASLGVSHVVLAVHGWLVASDPADGQSVPFYLQPSLGGESTLRGYPDYRFHDRNLLLVNAEARVPLLTHVDAAGFVDLGNVAPRVSELDVSRSSYGLGLRLHTRRQTFVRLDVARSSEGWRVLLRFTDPLELSRLSRRTATAPFVP